MLCVISIARNTPAQTIVRDSSVRSTAPGSSVFWLDAGVARSRQRGHDVIDATSLGAGLRRSTMRTAFFLDGAALLGTDSASAAQVRGSVSVAPLASGYLLTDVLGGFTRFRPFDNVGEGNRFAQLRQHVLFTRNRWLVSVRVDAGAGRTSRNVLGEQGWRVDDFFGTSHGLGLSLSRGAFSIASGWQRLRTNDYPLVEATNARFTRDASAYDFDHFSSSVTTQYRRWYWSGSVESQIGRNATTVRRHAASLGASYEVARGITLTGSTGKQLLDPVRGFPAARYSALAVRYTRFTGAADPGNHGREATLEFPPVTGGILLLHVRASDDAVVEIAHSAGGWVPIRLERVGNQFVGRVVLPAGTHRVAIRINGGEWRAPRGLARVADDLGGEVGLVVVP